MKCPYCGTDNAPGEQFCTNCGGYLDPSTANAQTIIASPTGASNVNNTVTSTVVAGPGGNSRSLTPNSRLQNGRYVIEKVLGQGGMGAALLTKDTRVSNKLVVIKELVSDNTDPVKRQEDVRNFEREVETLAQIDHPLVPTVTDSFQEGSRYFMVQEYIAGENLEDRMERLNHPMPEREALAYTSQVLDILDYLEQQKPPIVHRDIKPANIIVGSKDKRAHLVDFGIARADEARNAQKKQTSALGTPGYAPPEQYQGKADVRSDLYALAATLHHLLTNRDPRNYPPFAYPPARSLNPQLTADIEGVLSHALNIDVQKRYQDAAEFKRDVDEILAKHFNASADTSSYTLGMSGPMGNTRTQAAVPSTPTPAPPPIPINQGARQAQQARQQSNPQSGGYNVLPPQPPKRRNSGGYVGFSLGLLLLVIVLVGGAIFILPRLSSLNTQTGGSTPVSNTPVATANSGGGIGAATINGESIGLSDGSVAFDTNRADGSLKTQAAAKFAQNDIPGATALWQQAVQTESNDAEALIYLENQTINPGDNYITLVVGTMLTGGDNTVGRDDLQGAYIAQKQYNDGLKLTGGYKVRLLIGNAGSKDSKNALTVANRIVQAAKSDKTIIGVMGWPFSGYTTNVIQVLTDNKIPMVSPTASAISLTGKSPYFFRVCPSDDMQGTAGANYALQTLKVKNAAVFVDPADPYSNGLAQQFSDVFTQGGGTVVAKEVYQESTNAGRSDLAGKLLTDALSHNPDIIYFAGYAADLSPLLSNLTTPNVLVLGGDALYELNGYSNSTGARSNLYRLRFTTFFYPDEWSILGYQSKQPAFFTDYGKNLDPQNKNPGQYGFQRPSNDSALAYDATLALLTAYNNATPTGANSTVTSDDLRTGLTKTSFQGASGVVTFGANGNVVDKAVVILKFDQSQHVQFVSVQGKFLLAS